MNFNGGGTCTWRSQEMKSVKEGKEYRKERITEGILSTVLSIMRVKQLCYFNTEVFKTTYECTLIKEFFVENF